jgi:hypothetical protein
MATAETGRERFERMKSAGHRIRSEYTEYVSDSMEGYVVCECGWRTRSMKSCHWNRHIDAHLDEVERKADEHAQG